MGVLIPLILAGAFVGWNIGANDAGNCIGTSVGSGLISFKRAIVLVSGFAIAGGLLQGGHVMKTIGKGIVTSELSVLAVLTALICAGVFVAMATLLRLPVSTSEAIVGGVLGVGIASGADLNLTTILAIAGMGHLPHTRGGSGSPHLPSYEVPAEKAGEESLLATAPTGNAAGKRCIHLILPW
ncbi:inorganic phosphate transporter, partial [Candidatus Bipolaricaulota bacterium]|nr:inorganic phosphate transporter [Candidatus Bipolaricaulota bacterium]